MQNKEKKLIEKLVKDKVFVSGFKKAKTTKGQLKFLKENGFDFTE